MLTDTGPGWTRPQLLVAFALYCRTSFGRLHARNPEIIRIANAIDRTPGALAMKLVNIASLDPEITATKRRGLVNASASDRAMWDEMQEDWERFAVESDRATRGSWDRSRSGWQGGSPRQHRRPGRRRSCRANLRAHWPSLLSVSNLECIQRKVLYYRIVSARTAHSEPHRAVAVRQRQ